jgi:hypothetical protein
MSQVSAVSAVSALPPITASLLLHHASRWSCVSEGDYDDMLRRLGAALDLCYVA